MAIEKILEGGDDKDNAKDTVTSSIIPKNESSPDDFIGVDLRPKILREYVGQEEIVASLKTAIKASEARLEPMEHVELCSSWLTFIKDGVKTRIEFEPLELSRQIDHFHLGFY